MNTYTFHISLYDAAFFGMLFIGLTFALLLWFTKKANQAANRFLALAMVVIVLWIARLLGIDVGLSAYVPNWSRLPLQFSLALGPLIYFYVLKITRPEYKFRLKDLLHFSPLLLELGAQAWEVRDGIKTGAAAYETPAFRQLNPIFQLLAFVSVIIYLCLAHRLIECFYRRLKFNWGDRYRYELRWLHNLLVGFGLLWLLWIPFTAADYFYYHHQLGVHAYYPLYLLLAVTTIWMAAAAFSRKEAGALVEPPAFLKPLLHAEMKQKGSLLKRAMKTNRYHEDPELNLNSLAEKLGLTPHELSRVINTALKKNFHEFISEYRVSEVIQKMMDPAFDHITLLGIAYDSGFNSKSAFNRIFKEMTGKSPVEYKGDLKKEFPVYKPGRHHRFAGVISNHETTPKWSYEKLNRNYMFRNYLKVAWRNLVKNKTHSVINMAGLSVGLACSLLILLWVQNQYSVDAFYKNSGRLFKIYKSNFSNHVESGSYEMPGILADELKKVVPDIEYATNMGFGETSAFQAGDKVVKMNGNSAGADFFKMFSYRLLAGTPQTALNSPVAIAVSRKMAVMFYGSPENAIGKTIRYQNRKDFKITAVFEDLPQNASQTFDFLTNWDAFLDNNPWAREMGNNGPTAYVMLRPQANAAAVTAKVAHFFDLYWHIDRKRVTYYSDLALQQYAQAYLHNNLDSGKPRGGRIEYVELFGAIAIFILLIACINFMNLTTARSVKRAREIGVRKVVGALRSSLIAQFIIESVLVTAIAVIIALVLLIVALPEFNQITQRQIGLPFTQPGFWLKIVGITLITGLVSGSYPALFLSSFKPVKVLKSALKLETGTLFFRKGLVVFQFALSVILVTGTIIVSRQMDYIESKDLGYDREHLVYLPVEGQLSSRYGVFKNELLSQPGIASVSRISSPPADIYGSTPAVNWIAHDTTDNTFFTHAAVGYDYFKTMKLTLLAGREFSQAYPSDTSGYLLNEAALKLTGYKDPIGKPFTLLGRRGLITGIVKDFHFHSLHELVGPMVLTFGENQQWGVVLIRTQSGLTRQALTSIERLSKQLNPAFPPVVYFVDEEYQQLYQNEKVINKLSNIFAVLAIFISCLGLLGLAMFTAEQRVREIGIRKVLGAGITSLFTLLSAEFIRLIGIAIAIALPIAWYATNGWLQGFAYRAPLPWWVFALSGGLIVVIALITISFQVIKAALVNPVKSLKGE